MLTEPTLRSWCGPSWWAKSRTSPQSKCLKTSFWQQTGQMSSSMGWMTKEIHNKPTKWGIGKSSMWGTDPGCHMDGVKTSLTDSPHPSSSPWQKMDGERAGKNTHKRLHKVEPGLYWTWFCYNILKSHLCNTCDHIYKYSELTAQEDNMITTILQTVKTACSVHLPKGVFLTNMLIF